MNIRFFTFSQFHGKNPPTGSTQIRAIQLLKFWPEAEIYRYGEKPDVMIFQKVYMTQDYRFHEHFNGIKILDMCDPDWLDGMGGIKATIDAVDAVTVSSKGLQTFVKQLTDKPVVYIPDRFDTTVLPSPKTHANDAKTVVWFGYRHNAETLRPAMNIINELGLDLIVIADDDPLAWQWLPGEIGDEFRKTKYKYIKYTEDTIYADLQRADFAILPKGGRPIDPFKSNNKTIKAILSGLPVAKTAEDVRAFIKPAARREYLEKHYNEKRVFYDVRNSVQQYEDLIKEIQRYKENAS